MVLNLAKELADSAAIQSIARNQSDIGTFANRAVIWSSVYDEFSEFKARHLIGYGFKGQVASGIAKKNASLFAQRLDDVEGKTVHNFILQYQLDTGYLGVICIILLYISLQYALQNLRDKLLITSVGSGLVIGITEASPTMYQSELFFIFYIMIRIGLINYSHEQKV